MSGAARGQQPAIDLVWSWLALVPDPEIPAISIVDLGIVRSVRWDGTGAEATLVVAVTPTYSGCPATFVIEQEIAAALARRGIEHLRLERRLSPAWTTDWLSPAAKEKLRAFGIAPPEGQAVAGIARRLSGEQRPPACPRCGAREVERVSEFGSTPCKAHYRCLACREPFDHFKCH